MKSTLKIKTSQVSEENLKKILEDNYLPVFAINKISKDPVIGRYSYAPTHLRSLAPSEYLVREFNAGEFNEEVFLKRYAIEMSKVSLQDIVKRLEYLSDHNSTKGVVILTPPGTSYGKILEKILNYSGFFNTPVTEYDFK